MQSKLANKTAPRGALLGLAAATLLLVGAQSVPGQGASPVGFWDVVESGARGGVASMHFQTDGTNGTFTMDEIIVPNQARSSIGDIGRAGAGTGRNPSSFQGSTNTTLPPHTNLFGSVIFPVPNITNVVPQILVQTTTNLDVVTVTNIP